MDSILAGGSNVTVACLVWNEATTDSTPVNSLNSVWIVWTQWPQLIPGTLKVTVVI
jgi:hypothetical protein